MDNVNNTSRNVTGGGGGGVVGGGSRRVGGHGRGGSGIARDAKGIAQELKELLKKKDPFDREVEFQRQNLRKQYLSLIFRTGDAAPSREDGAANGSSDSKPSKGKARKDALNLLWIETCHAVIQICRQKIAEADRAIEQGHAETKANKRNRDRDRNGHQAGPPPLGPTARRKLVQSFRSFLAAEEVFWRDHLMVRMVRDWGLKEAEPRLKALGVVYVPDGHRTVDSLALNAIPEPDQAQDPATKAGKPEHSLGLYLCQKVMLCYGDLLRYREAYNDNTPAPTASSGNGIGRGANGGARGEDPRKGKKGRNTGAEPKKDRTFARAAECYTQARLLYPESGNPSNQLAVLAAYASDPFSSTYHYYRALCVSQPFPTAGTNLEVTYGKALSRWEEKDIASGSESRPGPKDADQAEELKEHFLVLHAMIHLQKSLEKAPAQSERVASLFQSCMEQRLLSSETIEKIVTTALCALWYIRASSTIRKSRRSSAKNTTEPSDREQAQKVQAEQAAFAHLLSILVALLRLGVTETAELTRQDVRKEEGIGPFNPLDLAQCISAVFRRTLPSLRIASKWMKGHVEYIARMACFPAPPLSERSLSVVIDLPSVCKDFWHAYAEFSNTLRTTFPPKSLPPLDSAVALEEDTDTLGFAPLRNNSWASRPESAAANNRRNFAQGEIRQMHPNEEQLIRIADLQADGVIVAEDEASMLEIKENSFSAVDEPKTTRRQLEAVAASYLSRVLGSAPPPPGLFAPPPTSDHLAGTSRVAQSVSSSTRTSANLDPLPPVGEMEVEHGQEYDEGTDDDPVDLAMRVVAAANIEDDEEGDDEILYPSRERFSPPRTTNGSPLSRPMENGGVISRNSSLLGRAATSSSPSLQSRPSQHSLHANYPSAGQSKGVNASDLLMQVLSGNVTSSTPGSSSVGPTQLNGGPPTTIATSTRSPKTSIWGAPGQPPPSSALSSPPANMTSFPINQGPSFSPGLQQFNSPQFSYPPISPPQTFSTPNVPVTTVAPGLGPNHFNDPAIAFASAPGSSSIDSGSGTFPGPPPGLSSSARQTPLAMQQQPLSPYHQFSTNATTQPSGFPPPTTSAGQFAAFG